MATLAQDLTQIIPEPFKPLIGLMNDLHGGLFHTTLEFMPEQPLVAAFVSSLMIASVVALPTVTFVVLMGQSVSASLPTLPLSNPKPRQSKLESATSTTAQKHTATPVSAGIKRRIVSLASACRALLVWPFREALAMCRWLISATVSSKGLRFPVEVRVKRRSDAHARRVELHEATFAHLLEALQAKLGVDFKAERSQLIFDDTVIEDDKDVEFLCKSLQRFSKRKSTSSTLSSDHKIPYLIVETSGNATAAGKGGGDTNNSISATQTRICSSNAIAGASEDESTVGGIQESANICLTSADSNCKAVHEAESAPAAAVGQMRRRKKAVASSGD